MEINEIIERNYKATIKRGKIDENTNFCDFIDKIEEEKEELLHSYYNYDQFDKSELADLVLVCFSMAKHFDIDIIEAIKEKTIFNENRKD